MHVAKTTISPQPAYFPADRSTTDSLDFLVYSALFLPDSDPDLAKTLVTKASEGVRVRVLLGDPNGDGVLRRGQEEGSTAAWRSGSASP